MKFHIFFISVFLLSISPLQAAKYNGFINIRECDDCEVLYHDGIIHECPEDSDALAGNDTEMEDEEES